MNNTQVRMELEKEYQPICMCGGIVRQRNPLTMHHIIQRSMGGETNTKNGSLVANLEHSGLHILMDDDSYKRKLIIEYLREYKAMILSNKDPLAMKVAFHIWLEQCVKDMEYTEYETKDNLLIYKKKIYKGRYQ